MATKWKLVRLELARTVDFPAGSASRAYCLRLPLTESGEIDEAAFETEQARATYRRHWASDPDESGEIRPRDGQFALSRSGKADRVLQLGGWPVRPGQHISLVDDGATLPLKVVSVR